jgi:23S rRNA pseudouridine1911/1915/1917 synthase
MAGKASRNNPPRPRAPVAGREGTGEVVSPTLAAVVREQAGVAWSKAKQLCLDGRVTVDGARCTDPAARVATGAVVVVDPYAPKQQRAGVLAESAIVFHDRDLVVFDKPAGMLSVEDEPGNKDIALLHVRTLLRRLGAGDAPLSVVHRLDRDTSGVMVFTRTASAQKHLAIQFRDHTVERAYLAIAHGEVAAAHVDTQLLLDRGDGLRGSFGHYRRVRGDPPSDARRAITHLEPLEALRGATLVECRLETGRQHQIRIHLAELGHPLVGERVYIRDFEGRKIEAARTMLHARLLGFEHPSTGERLCFERPAPIDFEAMLRKLR